MVKRLWNISMYIITKMLKELPSIDNKKGWPWTEETSKNLYQKAYTYPKISIITPSFNQGQFIEETIRSVILQQYPNLEYIIIDGGSTDETIEIIKKYEQYITYWVSEPDSGQSNAINKGLEKCTGDIFNWLNSDDYLEPNALFNISKEFIENKNIDVVCAKSRIFSETKSIFSSTPIGSSLKETISKARIDQPATYFRFSTFQNLRPVNEDLHLTMDLHFWLKYIVENGLNNIKELDKVIVNFREHEGSKTIKENTNFFYERVALLNEIQNIILGQPSTTNYYKQFNYNADDKDNMLIGINDFIYFWYKYFKKSDDELASFLLKNLNKNYLKLTDRIKLLF